MPGEENVGNDFGADRSGYLSTRNLLMALVSLSLVGSGTSVVQSANVTDRWTLTNQKQYERGHLEKHESERALAISEYSSLAQRVSRIETQVTEHQDGHPDRVEAKVERLEVRVEKNTENVRSLERTIDRKIP